MTIRTEALTISASNAADAKAWAKELKCTVAELRIALRAVGTSTSRVKAYLAALRGHPLLPAGADSAAQGCTAFQFDARL
jgi:CO/xanthine dehydrogenase FAD-binding subunit